MKKMEHSIEINAPKEKVWNALWDDKSYREWTSPFSEGSYAESDWKEGSKILFLDGKGSGMVSRIEKMTPNEFMSFEHLGIMKDGVEDTTSDDVKQWAGSHEDYKLEGRNGKTKLTVHLDMDEKSEFWNYMQETWPKALDKLKNLAESN